jgi:hypothetical protein
VNQRYTRFSRAAGGAEPIEGARSDSAKASSGSVPDPIAEMTGGLSCGFPDGSM